MAVIKLGKKGSLAVKDGVTYEAPAFTVKAVDTTGAGDSFNAGFIYGYLRQMDIRACLECGNAAERAECNRPGREHGLSGRRDLTYIYQSTEREELSHENCSNRGAGVRTVIFINGLLDRYKKLHIDEVVLYDIQEGKAEDH